MTYPWSAGQVLTASALNDEFASKVDYATPTNAQTGTAYTFVADDAERLTTASNGSAVTLTVPPQSSVTWSDNTILRVANYGTGEVTVDGGSGVTVTNTETTLAQYTTADVVRTASDAWTLLAGGGGGGGKILQVVRATDGTDRTTTSTSFVDVTGLSVTITPSDTSSVILLIATGLIRTERSPATTTSGDITIQITDNSNNAISGAEASRQFMQIADDFDDKKLEAPATVIGYATPATTSATTYKVRFKAGSGSNTASYLNNSNTGQLFAIEVSA